MQKNILADFCTYTVFIRLLSNLEKSNSLRIASVMMFFHKHIL